VTDRTTAEHYVYLYQQGSKVIEVVLTGRIAKKQGSGRRPKEIILHEIKSADDDVSFRDWIRKDQLFTIEDED
jgi:hypothetical protein